MVGTNDILKQLILSTIQAADLQRIRITDLNARDFPANHSKDFINALIEFNKEILKILREKLILFEQLSEKDDFENLHNYIIQYSYLLWKLNYITHIIERSDRTHVGESNTILLSEFTKGLNDYEIITFMKI